MKRLLAFVRRPDWALFLVCSAIFINFPEIDLWFASQFYQDGFYLNDNPVVYGIYWLFAKPHFVIIPLLIALAIIYHKKFKDTDHHKKWIFSFLLASLILGPGVLVNSVLKDNSIGRARPVHIEPYGGDKTFTAAYQYSGQCQRNCSFVSGHASMGFFFIGLGWLLRSKRAFWLGFGIGCVVGFGRVVQGGHFFSDVVLAFWAVYFVNLALGYWWKLDNPLNTKPDA